MSSAPLPCIGLRESADLMRLDLVMAIVGDLSSSNSMPMSLLAGTYSVPTISPASTAEDLSDKTLYPYFSRTVPPDTQQAQAIVDVCLLYSWTSVRYFT
jgi:ABC-type branched-subunit amino acid transport system substrate-binding protein